MLNVYFQSPDGTEQGFRAVRRRRKSRKRFDLGSKRSGEHLRYITQTWFQDDLGVVWPEFQVSRVDREVMFDSSLLLSTEAVAFFPPRPHPYLPCFAPLSRERLSLCTALQTKILWINWSLNAIDTIRNLGFGEPDCPDGTFAAGYTMVRGRGGESCV